MPHKGRLPVPDKDAIATLPPFERLDLSQVRLVSTAEQAEAAWQTLRAQQVLGFDTESKPTFLKDQVSDGPHIVQLATQELAWVFQLGDAHCRLRVAHLLQEVRITKAGFGLGDDRKRIVAKLGVEPQAVLDLNHLMHARGWRKDMGVRAAVAVLFGRNFAKSKKCGHVQLGATAAEQIAAALCRQRCLGGAAGVPGAGLRRVRRGRTHSAKSSSATHREIAQGAGLLQDPAPKLFQAANAGSVHIAATNSPMASALVSPGDSMPNRFTRPGAPCWPGP